MKSIINPMLFCYTIAPQSIGTGVTVQPQINFDNSSDFELIEIRASVYKAAAFSGTIILNLSEASGNNFQNAGVDLLSFASTAQNNYSGYPIRLPYGTVIPANTQLNVQVTNNNGETVTVQLQLWGFKRDRQTAN